MPRENEPFEQRLFLGECGAAGRALMTSSPSTLASATMPLACESLAHARLHRQAEHVTTCTTGGPDQGESISDLKAENLLEGLPITAPALPVVP